MGMATQFDDEMAVVRLDAEIFTAKIEPSWWALFGPHGGHLAAIILGSMHQAVGR